MSVEDQDLENVDEKILHWFTTCLNTNELKKLPQYQLVLKIEDL